MFKAQRQSALEQVRWKPEHSGGLSVIETTDEETPKLRHSGLKDAEVQTWVLQNSCLPGVPPPKTKSGGFRLLLCERSKLPLDAVDCRPASSRDLYMSRDSFALIEQAFRLSDTTAQDLFFSNGGYSRFTERDSSTAKIKYLKVAIQARRKLEVGDCVLSVCHCCETGWTYGFLCGEGVVESNKRFGEVALASVMLNLLRPCLHLRSHVLLLPAMLLKIYSMRIVSFMYKQLSRLNDLEDEIGVTNAGRCEVKRSLEHWPHDVDIKDTTLGLHSAGAELFYLNQTSCWTHECLKFLCQLSADCSDYPNTSPATCLEVQQAIEHEIVRTQWVGRTLATGKERTQAQLSVLYSAASQKENAISIKYSRMAQEQNENSRKEVHLNTRIATSTKQDSIAMTAFTFIAALFLPGTYTSSLFSMGMFDWLPSNAAKCYAYWCITVPMTAVVMAGWFTWYKRADQAFQREMEHRLGGGDDGEKKPPADGGLQARTEIHTTAKITWRPKHK
ncbi:uncharacterized protein A1O5_02115 [Cladophialophora psammophila CBS 110553]|uniref:Uncharacterized protein n=1 Tax=Cladophialophora psammophila CBS 110553 TaxID=1182543 RepID=W9XYT3_9EURO|nr:uncharacterized protein A1O5_02115 [Cladophialophora psammophila CBS 110553]EXJ75419.1 hypothetical protein A1O5_02115 [Cladophialophora psammophila CBS 110553]